MEGFAFGNFHVTEIWLAVCEVDYDWGQLRGLGGRREAIAYSRKVGRLGRVRALAWGCY